ncbi:hypothetical protein H5T58_03760, partial [Candidatus Parcubacteria bacterium]|nr:hypothetical protein [Candidatus Parcubacteria bacterium]
MKEKQEITVMEGVKAILREPTLSFPINVLRELAQLSLRYSQLLLQSANTEKERKYLHEKIESLFSQVPTLKKIIFEKERVAVSFVLRKRKSWNLPILEQILKDNLSQYVTFSISVRAFGALSGNEKERILHELEQVLKTFRLNFE